LEHAALDGADQIRSIESFDDQYSILQERPKDEKKVEGNPSSPVCGISVISWSKFKLILHIKY